MQLAVLPPDSSIPPPDSSIPSTSVSVASLPPIPRSVREKVLVKMKSSEHPLRVRATGNARARVIDNKNKNFAREGLAAASGNHGEQKAEVASARSHSCKKTAMLF